MRILLDENLPHKLRIALAGREVLTVAYMGWSGLKNGELIRMAEADGIDVLLTGDQNIAYQQNIASRRLAIIILSVTNWLILKDQVTNIKAAIERATPGSFEVIDCGTFRRS